MSPFIQKEHPVHVDETDDEELEEVLDPDDEEPEEVLDLDVEEPEEVLDPDVDPEELLCEVEEPELVLDPNVELEELPCDEVDDAPTFAFIAAADEVLDWGMELEDGGIEDEELEEPRRFCGDAFAEADVELEFDTAGKASVLSLHIAFGQTNRLMITGRG
jgi:hypothetical protein